MNLKKFIFQQRIGWFNFFFFLIFGVSGLLSKRNLAKAPTETPIEAQA